MSNDERAKRSGGDPRGGPRRLPGDRAGSVDELRRILVGPEQERIEEVEDRLTSVETVGERLPEEVVACTKARGDELAISLEPSVSRAVRSVARKETEVFADVLSPVIGAAIRKSLAQAIRAIRERFDEALENSFSVESLRWRLEAKRTGRPLAEVVMLHTLVYRVEQVFLIHSESGLVLGHVTDEGIETEDPDQVASMLTAIDAFAQDALKGKESCVHLGRLEFGDLTGWIERGSRATMAAFVRGVAPSHYGDVLRESLERIELEHRDALLEFRSDITPFDAAIPTLEECLKSERTKPARRGPLILAALGVLTLIGLIGLIYVMRERRADAREVFTAHVAALEDSPGIVVTSADRDGDEYAFAGLRDPLADDPARILARRGVDDAELAFEPFQSLDSKIVEAREALVAARSGADRLERFVIPFGPGSEEPGEARGRLLDEAAAIAARLVSDARAVDLRACVFVRGHTDPSGTEEANETLRFARARAVVSALAQRGVSEDHLSVRGGDGRPGRDRAVTFDVDLRGLDAPSACQPT